MSHMNLKRLERGQTHATGGAARNPFMRIAIFEEELPQMQLLVATLAQQISTDAGVISCTQFRDAKALQLALSEGCLFDLLILDYNYEEFGGLALLRWLRTHQKSTVPVIMLSQRNSERDIADSLSAGADDFMAKPFRPIDLMARIERFLTIMEVARGRDAHPSCHRRQDGSRAVVQR